MTLTTPYQAAPRRRLGGRTRFRPGRMAGAAAMTICALFAALPLLFMVNNGLRTDGQIILNPLGIVSDPQFGNIVTAWQGGGLGQSMGRPFFNSVIVTTISVLAVTILATFAGYALGAYRYRGAAVVTQVILVLVAVPTQALIIPVFDMLQNWNLTNNYLGLILVYSAFWLPFSVLLMRAAARAFPRELLEAGRIDGLSEFGLLWRVAIPLMRGPIQGIAVVSAIGIWSELLFAYVIMNQPDTRTLPAAALAFQGEYTTNYPLLYSALIIAVLPMIVFYALLASKIRKGVTAGALH
jgi:ABC-type glycerol-3-phosphate transport system permease component